MKYFKFTLRLIVCMIFILPSVPIIYVCSSLFGLAFGVLIVCGSFNLIAGFLTNDRDRILSAKDMFDGLCWLLAMPFYFWYRFVTNNKPFEVFK